MPNHKENGITTLNLNQARLNQQNRHTNTVEGYFSILKRGITGVYQHVSQQHLKRYLGEFDFRYNTRDIDDMERTVLAAKGIVGKRLTYRRTNKAANA